MENIGVASKPELRTNAYAYAYAYMHMHMHMLYLK